MSERAAEVGGAVKVVSSPGQGTEVRIEIPYPSPGRPSLTRTDRASDGMLEPSGRMTVLLVDDHPLFLNALAEILTAHDIDVAGLARDGFEAVQLAQKLKPDIVVMDIQMPRCDGLTATHFIKSRMPETKVVILTMVETDEALFQAMKNGASGYLLKDLDGDEFVDRLLGLERGEVPISPSLASKLLDEFGEADHEAATASADRQLIDETLSARQVEILTLVAKGMTYRKIAEMLSLSERTIKYHMGEIVAKLHVKNRRQAVELARKAGL